MQTLESAAHVEHSRHQHVAERHVLACSGKLCMAQVARSDCRM